MSFIRAVFPLLVLGILMMAPTEAFAANASFFGPIIQADCQCEGTAPDWGCVLDTAHNVFNLIFSLSILVFVFTAAYAGFLFMGSSINAEGKSKAKAMLLNTVVGLLIALSAWLMVDFVMRVLYDDSAGFGPWNRILADGDNRRCLRSAGPAPSLGLGVDEDGLTVDTADGAELTADVANGTRVECNKNNAGPFVAGAITGKTVEGGTLVDVSVRYDDGSTESGIPPDRCRILADEDTTDRPSGNWQSFFGFDSGISAQAGYASPALDSLLSCMAGTLARDGQVSVSRISSISSSGIAAGRVTPQVCAAGSGTGYSEANCPHMRNSCHYGGATCNDDGKSYSADFGNENQANLLISAANACGAVRAALENGDHVHVTAPNRCGTNGGTCR